MCWNFLPCKYFSWQKAGFTSERHKQRRISNYRSEYTLEEKHWILARFSRGITQCRYFCVLFLPRAGIGSRRIKRLSYLSVKRLCTETSLCKFSNFSDMENLTICLLKVYLIRQVKGKNWFWTQFTNLFRKIRAYFRLGINISLEQ